MEDYYDYYLARPPQSHGKALTFPPPATDPQDLYENENPVQEMNFTTKYVPGSLGTITETEKESVTSSESYRRKEFEKLDSFALEPEEVNKRFINFLRERNKDLDVIDLEDQIAKELDLDISDEEVRKVIGELHVRNKELREGKMRNKETFVYDVERLKEEVLLLKKQHNYDKAVIKILKINLRKGKGGPARSEKLAAREKEKNKLLERLQAVYDENTKLKQDLQVQDQDYKQKISKLNALNSEMTKMLNAKFPGVISEKSASKEDAAAHVAVLRLKMRGLNEEKEEMKQKIEKYENDMMKLRQTIEDRDPAKFESQIDKLKEEKEELVVEKEYIMTEMKLDKQLQTLFPNTGNLALVTLNFAHQVEKNRFIKTTYNKTATSFLNLADSAFSKIMPAFEKMGNRIMFHITKNSEYHPDTKKIVQATITAWNNSAISGKHINAQNEEIHMLEDRIKFLEKEVEHAGVAGRPFSLMKDDQPLKKGEGSSTVFSLKEMEDHKKQWDNLPPFVKKYIKQLEGEVIGLKPKKGKKKKDELEDDKKAKKPKKENQALPLIIDKKSKEQNTVAEASKQNEKKDKNAELATLGFASKIKKDLATETKGKKAEPNKTKEK